MERLPYTGGDAAAALACTHRRPLKRNGLLSGWHKTHTHVVHLLDAIAHTKKHTLRQTSSALNCARARCCCWRTTTTTTVVVVRQKHTNCICALASGPVSPESLQPHNADDRSGRRVRTINMFAVCCWWCVCLCVVWILNVRRTAASAAPATATRF